MINYTGGQEQRTKHVLSENKEIYNAKTRTPYTEGLLKCHPLRDPGIWKEDNYKYILIET